MLKISLLFKKFIQTSRANNSRILMIKTAKFSGCHFYMNRNRKGDFQICISVPLILHLMIYLAQFDRILHLILQCDFILTYMWFYKNHMVLNFGKCHYLLIGNHDKPDNRNMEIQHDHK